ncbi:SRPBCC domain-containing protein [Streptomyces sp. RS10V-4]|uniref:SRPBCC family protein n=1 Tax=Streptomyces rhizoryzae TaxID=2932493 RepID=UPI002006CF48|nr:SRPBCC domain-containing protein [Streptomyces rhizoryzae]MCK7624246.1 SRPBCC domain-containing protein [Streptomyces rhizoryzae]
MTPHGFPAPGDDPADATALRVDHFLPHPPAAVWRALTEPELLAQWMMPGDFRLEVGHRYTLRTLPRPNANFSGTVIAEVLGYEVERSLRLRWQDADEGQGNRADWTLTWTLEPEGRGTRLFLVHEGFDPDDPYQVQAHRIMSGGWRSIVTEGLGNVLNEL